MACADRIGTSGKGAGRGGPGLVGRWHEHVEPRRGALARPSRADRWDDLRREAPGDLYRTFGGLVPEVGPLAVDLRDEAELVDPRRRAEERLGEAVEPGRGHRPLRRPAADALSRRLGCGADRRGAMQSSAAPTAAAWTIRSTAAGSAASDELVASIRLRMRRSWARRSPFRTGTAPMADERPLASRSRGPRPPIRSVCIARRPMRAPREGVPALRARALPMRGRGAMLSKVRAGGATGAIEGGSP
jgi:hypothetical protein